MEKRRDACREAMEKVNLEKTVKASLEKEIFDLKSEILSLQQKLKEKSEETKLLKDQSSSREKEISELKDLLKKETLSADNSKEEVCEELNKTIVNPKLMRLKEQIKLMKKKRAEFEKSQREIQSEEQRRLMLEFGSLVNRMSLLGECFPKRIEGRAGHAKAKMLPSQKNHNGAKHSGVVSDGHLLASQGREQFSVTTSAEIAKVKPTIQPTKSNKRKRVSFEEIGESRLATTTSHCLNTRFHGPRFTLYIGFDV